MLVSFSDRLVFVKTKKTASTSIEAALESNLFTEQPSFYRKLRIYRHGLTAALGQGDFSRKFSVHGANRTDARPCISLAFRHQLPWRKLTTLRDHSGPRDLVALLGTRRYRDFIKVTSVRNPFDLMVSLYYFNTRQTADRPKFNDWVQMQRRPKINEAIVPSLDKSWKVIRFENLDSDLTAVFEDLKIPHHSPLPKTKSQFRPVETRNYREHYCSQSRAYVEDLWADWFETFNYKW